MTQIRVEYSKNTDKTKARKHANEVGTTRKEASFACRFKNKMLLLHYEK